MRPTFASSQGVVCGLRDGLRQANNLGPLLAKGDIRVHWPNRKQSAKSDAARYSPVVRNLLQYSQGSKIHSGESGWSFQTARVLGMLPSIDKLLVRIRVLFPRPSTR